jgi:hypothetical protein
MIIIYFNTMAIILLTVLLRGWRGSIMNSSELRAWFVEGLRKRREWRLRLGT